MRLPDRVGQGDEEITTVVQPDLSVICDPKKLDDAGCVGAPDLVVEILSVSTAYKDQTAKLTLFERHGVREYWIVDPETRTIEVLKAGQTDSVQPLS